MHNVHTNMRCTKVVPSSPSRNQSAYMHSQQQHSYNNFACNHPAAFRGYWAVLLAMGTLYVLTSAPGPLWQDSGLFQYRIWHNDIEGKLGLALAHPLYCLVGIAAKQIPLGEFARRVNLISAVFAAIATANVFLLLYLWRAKVIPAITAVLMLGLSHTFWQHGCIAEVYSMYLAFFSAELIMLLLYCQHCKIKYLYALALLNGLSIAVHMWGIIALACYAVFIIAEIWQKRIKTGQVAIMLLLWLVGVFPYAFLIVKNMLQSGDIIGTLASAAFGNVWENKVLNSHITAGIIKQNIMFFGLNFPTPAILTIFVGWAVLQKVAPRRGFYYVFVALSALFLSFAFRYTVPDRYVFFLPFYLLLAVTSGLGTELIIKKAGQQRAKITTTIIILTTLLPIPVYAVLPSIAQKLHFKLGTTRQIPYRNDYNYFLQPWQYNDNGPALFAQSAFNTMAKNAIIYADSTTAPPLLYRQDINKKRPDIQIISSISDSTSTPEFNQNTIAELLKKHAIYVVSPVHGYCPKFLLTNYNFKKAGVIWQVTEKTNHMNNINIGKEINK